MQIQKEKCTGCGTCIPYCPVGAIKLSDKKAFIEVEECVECGTCGRKSVVKCPTNAIVESIDAYERPRSISKFFSDPTAYHVETKIPGRGTEEVKTNDVTGRVKKGEVGICIEVGRPCLGTNFDDIEKITTSLTGLGAEYAANNPLTCLMKDHANGTFPDELKRVNIASGIIEFKMPVSKMGVTLKLLRDISKEIDTVFSLSIITRLEPDGKIPIRRELKRLGFAYRANAKINMGMGRPLKEA